MQEETPSILWYSGSCSSNRVSAITGGENRLRFSPGDQIRRDRRMRSPGVSLA